MLPALAGIGLPLLEHASTEDSFAVTGRIVLGAQIKTQVKKALKRGLPVTAPLGPVPFNRVSPTFRIESLLCLAISIDFAFLPRLEFARLLNGADALDTSSSRSSNSFAA